MKNFIALLTVVQVFCTIAPAWSATEAPVVGGPKGGRLLEQTEPRAEFFVETDHGIVITFYDADLKPVPVGEQTVTVIAESEGEKSLIEFEKSGDVLISKQKLPEGHGYNLVVQFRQTPEVKPKNIRFKLETHICGSCHRAEYACICDE